MPLRCIDSPISDLHTWQFFFLLFARTGPHFTKVLRRFRQDNVLLRVAKRIILSLVPRCLATKLVLISEQSLLCLFLG